MSVLLTGRCLCSSLLLSPPVFCLCHLFTERGQETHLFLCHLFMTGCYTHTSQRGGRKRSRERENGPSKQAGEKTSSRQREWLKGKWIPSFSLWFKHLSPETEPSEVHCSPSLLFPLSHVSIKEYYYTWTTQFMLLSWQLLHQYNTIISSTINKLLYSAC